MPTFYKVVCPIYTGAYVSPFVPDEYKLEYRRNMWTKPEFGKLFVFTDKNTAKYRAKGFVVFTCDVIDAVDLEEAAMFGEDFVSFWNGNNSIDLLTTYDTAVASAVMLKERIL